MPSTKPAPVNAESDRGTVTVRPLTHDDLTEMLPRLAAGEEIDLIKKHHSMPFLVHATLSKDPNVSRREDFAKPVYPSRERTGRNGTTLVEDAAVDPVGVQVKVRTVSEFHSTGNGSLFSTAEAENAAHERGYSNPSGLRRDLYLPCESDHPAAVNGPLAPVFGAEASVRLTVRGVDEEALKARIEEMVRAEFGDRVSPLMRVKTRDVIDFRVDVYSYDSIDGSRRPLAMGVLESEKSDVMALFGTAVHVEEHKGNVVMGYLA